MIHDIIFRLSLRNIRINLLRSILAALGITIGVIAIASMGMMGVNMTLSVTAELSKSNNILVVSPYSGGGGGPPMMGGGSDDEDYLTEKEVNNIEKAVAKYGVSYPLYSTRDKFSIGQDEYSSSMYGVDESTLKSVLTLTEGAYPSGTHSVIVGPDFAADYGVTIGSRLKIGDPDDPPQTSVRVSGIIEERGNTMDMNTDRGMVMTEDLYTSIFGGEGEYTSVVIVLNDISDSDAAKEAVDAQLNRREDVVSIQDNSRMISSITSTIGTLTTFVTAIAGISLLVAAVSIFNVMMMSVTERYREIGILRSIGTQKGEIRRMFLYEAGIIGLVGSGIGTFLSLILGYLFVDIMVGNTAYFFTLESLVYLPSAMVIGILICVLSGVFPAWRAADLDPIEAIRSE
jgi:putative ABC transport system permease protein